MWIVRGGSASMCDGIPSEVGAVSEDLIEQ